ncbi:MAG: hypoxanthine phosphoribosyltransferase, partial [Verrucomicrobiales bacterium]
MSEASPLNDEADIGRILLTAETIEKRLDELAETITQDYRSQAQPLTVVVILTGALVFAADLLRRIPLAMRIECLSASSYYSGKQTSGQVSLGQLDHLTVSGRPVLILDDILDSGLTLHAVQSRLQERMKGAQAKICVLLRKDRPRQAQVDADYVAFDIENEFIVGYGLDFSGRYRNLPYIGVLKDGI